MTQNNEIEIRRTIERLRTEGNVVVGRWVYRNGNAPAPYARVLDDGAVRIISDNEETY